jgi:predicted aspartyl protease
MAVASRQGDSRHYAPPRPTRGDPRWAQPPEAMWHRACALILSALMLAAGVTTPATAQDPDTQVYQWVDDEGTVHYTTGAESVPERYRPTARPLAAPRGPMPEVSRVATIPFAPGGPIVVQATVNGAGAVTLILDTGADRTMISPAALTRLGVALPQTYQAEVRGVTGATRADLVWVSSLDVNGLTVGPMAVVAHDPGLRAAEGLLGREFLGVHTVTIDTLTGVVTIRAR